MRKVGRYHPEIQAVVTLYSPLLWHQITWRMASSPPFEEPPPPYPFRLGALAPLPSMQQGASFSPLSPSPLLPLLPLLLATRGLVLSPHIPPLLPSPPCNGSITMTAGSRGVRRGTGKHEPTSSLFFCSPPETRVALFDVTAYVTATSARWCCAGRGLAHTFLRPFFARGSHIALSLRGYS